MTDIMDNSFFSYLTKKERAIYYIITTCLLLATASLIGSARHYLENAIVILLTMAATTALNAIYFKNILKSISEGLDKFTSSIGTTKNRHFFMPDSISKIPAAINFHLEQLIIENYQLSSEIDEIETIYTSILNTQDELVFVIDKEGYISYHNRAFDSLFGTPSLDFDDEASIFSENLSSLMRKISPYIFTKENHQSQKTLLTEIFIQGQNRQILWAINKITKSESNKILFVGRDETESIQIRKEAEKLQKIAAVGRAASTIFHEINQPLSIINLSTFMIRKNLDSLSNIIPINDLHDIFNNIDIIEKQIDRSNQIIKNLRLFHSADRRMISLETINVDHLLGEAIRAVRQELDTNCISLVVNINHSLDLSLQGNETLFNQVLVNILRNSIQALSFCENNYSKVITINSDERNDKVLITIEDTGPGIPENLIPQVTEPFYSTKNEGSGLGLALCLDILNSYNGSLFIRNLKPHGLSVTAEFPLYSKPVEN